MTSTTATTADGVEMPPSGQRQSVEVVDDDLVFTTPTGRILGQALVGLALAIVVGGAGVAALEGDVAETLLSPEIVAFAVLIVVPLLGLGVYLLGTPDRYAILDTTRGTLATTRWWSGRRGASRRTDELYLESQAIAPGEGEDRWSAALMATDGERRGFRVLLWTTEIGDPDAARRAAEALERVARWKGRRTAG